MHPAETGFRIVVAEPLSDQAMQRLRAVATVIEPDQKNPDAWLVALDRAEVLIEENAEELKAIWGNGLPGSLQEIHEDAKKALTLARVIISDTI